MINRGELISRRFETPRGQRERLFPASGLVIVTRDAAFWQRRIGRREEFPAVENVAASTIEK